MPQNNYNQERQKFKQFRDKSYQIFNYRRDTLMDLVDVISANTTARSPVELSLSALFRREYTEVVQTYKQFKNSKAYLLTKLILVNFFGYFFSKSYLVLIPYSFSKPYLEVAE